MISFEMPRAARVACLSLVALCAMVASCDDPVAPEVPSTIQIFTGDGQYSKFGTTLDIPLAVTLRWADGLPAPGFVVRFEVLEGGGSVSSSSVRSNDAGQASTRLTLGPAAGDNTVRATVAEATDLQVSFQATAGDFFCPEEDPVFVRKFQGQYDLFLLTRNSSLHTQNSLQRAGIARVVPNPGAVPPSCALTSVVTFSEDFITNVPKDAAFSRAGDLFIGWLSLFPEVIKVEPGPIWGQFSFLDEIGSELTTSPGAILMGCDAVGPFAVGCRDTLTRFTEATYTNVGLDMCNNDAVAVDPNNEDLYFIYLGDNTLRRLVLSGLTVGGPVETVTQLTADEATGARGMVVDDDAGEVYILVESANTKAIVKVTAGGTRTTALDFTTRGAGDAAGVQDDLAIFRPGLGAILYTVDTLNDKLLQYNTNLDVFIEMTPTTADALSDPLSSGERVGLVLVP